MDRGVEDLHHLGVIYRVVAGDVDAIRTDPDGQDSDGALWVPIADLVDWMLTPFARTAIETLL